MQHRTHRCFTGRASLFFLFFLMFSPLLSGCGIIDVLFLDQYEETPLDLVEEGNLAMEEKKYSKAIKKYTQLKDRYPFSPYTTEAELKLADAYYLDEQFFLAEVAYKEFESLHPSHESIVYVLYQIGLSNYHQFISVDRPLTPIEEAIQYFDRVAQSYPDSEFADKSMEFKRKSRIRLAQHELHVADFYWNDKQYGPAWKRYEYVKSNFSDLPDIYQYANRRSDLAYFKYQKDRSEKRRKEEHGSWEAWFRWL